MSDLYLVLQVLTLPSPLSGSREFPVVAVGVPEGMILIAF